MFSKKSSLLLKGTVFYTAAMMLVACGGEAPKDDEVVAPVEDSTAVSSDDSELESCSLPSPLLIASIFKKSGLKYQGGITSSVKDPAKYTSSLSQTINLGVYSADLAYTILNKQNQESITYMNLSRKLADKLGMTSVFEENNLAKRFEKNLGNEDSLTNIISELQMASDTYLSANNQQQITSIAFAGAWVESIYIGSKLYEKGKSEVLNKKLAEQLNILSSIIKGLTMQVKKDPAIAGLVTDLQTIQDVYNELPSVKNNPNVEDSEIELSFTEDEIASLTKKIEEVRTKFING